MTEPQPVASTVASLQARLKAKGLNLTTAADLDTARRETDAEREARLDARLVHARARWAARLPVMFTQASLADLGQGYPNVVGWLATDSPTLVLAGSVGTGKTHAAYAIGNAAAADGTWVEAWTTHDLLEALRPGGDPAAQSAARCDVLILDDLGASKASEWAKDELTSLVDTRLREGRRQVVTTNHPYEVLAETWGQRLLDRLAYRWTVQTMTGESRRRKAAW